jgi:uncharacterized damage-inducible protein DinB
MDTLTTMTAPTASTTGDRERADLLESLEVHRGFLRQTLAGITDEQAAQRPTASALCLGGLLKHVTRTESRWVDYILQGPEAMAMSEASYAEHAASFEMAPGDTVAELLEAYDQVARRTAEVLLSLPDLDVSQALPDAPWFPAGATRSARRVFVHIVAETAQHAGHADIIRESIDGARTMG